MGPKAKECLLPPELEEAGRTLLRSLGRELRPADTLTLGLWLCARTNSSCLKPLHCGTSVWQQQPPLHLTC